ncbi:hypothetical protein AIOL_001564 [Candidatus Rhodobacter oscarellae]|uniref:Cell division protein ZapA n=1 Tax=Candidatus Rhodobacter oscarellae TaxID=1675527 RepID=A0A0J9E1M6_9RHOB|nr:cell division protein ZapA [Candidatus Rhodobacter lobularis]KMW56610.1 hypothetical protein AIOL_001564 [Candidatus Rhodobacter lobularis]
MPDVMISIGGREFSVACQDGEEHFLHSAAALLDKEASALTAQIGGLPEARMLLMSGLLLADKTAGADDQLKAANERIEALEAEVAQLKSAGGAGPERIEVPVEVIPDSVTDTMAELAARAEALAAEVEEKAAS